MSNHAIDQARGQLKTIKELVYELRNAADRVDGKRVDDAYHAIIEHPLSVLMRSGWVEYGAEIKPEEYEILLCWGGPAVRIVGDLNEHFEPESAHIEYQDWFTPWGRYPLTVNEECILLEYAQQFYFG